MTIREAGAFKNGPNDFALHHFAFHAGTGDPNHQPPSARGYAPPRSLPPTPPQSIRPWSPTNSTPRSGSSSSRPNSSGRGGIKPPSKAASHRRSKTLSRYPASYDPRHRTGEVWQRSYRPRSSVTHRDPRYRAPPPQFV